MLTILPTQSTVFSVEWLLSTCFLLSALKPIIIAARQIIIIKRLSDILHYYLDGFTTR